MWRFYVQRAGTGKWLDTNAQIADPELSWVLSGPNTGKGLIQTGIGNFSTAEDGLPMWGKFRTLLYAEEDGELTWVGICSSAKPSDKGLQLEFIGAAGWLQKVPFTGIINTWKVNVFDVVRALVNNTVDKKPGFTFIMPNTLSKFAVGDPAPPAKPKQPARKKGETAAHWQASAAYKKWQADNITWNTLYADKKPFNIEVWSANYVGAEIDSLAKEVGFDYRERVVWRDKSQLIPAFFLDFADNLRNRRTDIKFVDGMNLSAPLDPKDRTEAFANHVIGLGAGEGRAMLRVEVGQPDGALYQGSFSDYKSITNANSLRALAQADYVMLSNQSPLIDTLSVWDVPGFADIKTLNPGDEIEVQSNNIDPPIDEWVRILKITRDNSIVATIAVETVG